MFQGQYCFVGSAKPPNPDGCTVSSCSKVPAAPDRVITVSESRACAAYPAPLCGKFRPRLSSPQTRPRGILPRPSRGDRSPLSGCKNEGRLRSWPSKRERPESGPPWDHSEFQKLRACTAYRRYDSVRHNKFDVLGLLGCSWWPFCL